MVVVAFVLGHHLVPLGAHGLHIDAVHGGKVGGVKTRADHVIVNRLFVGVFMRFNDVGCGGVHGFLRSIQSMLWKTGLVCFIGLTCETQVAKHGRIRGAKSF